MVSKITFSRFHLSRWQEQRRRWKTSVCAVSLHFPSSSFSHPCNAGAEPDTPYWKDVWIYYGVKSKHAHSLPGLELFCSLRQVESYSKAEVWIIYGVSWQCALSLPGLEPFRSLRRVESYSKAEVWINGMTWKCALSLPGLEPFHSLRRGPCSKLNAPAFPWCHPPLAYSCYPHPPFTNTIIMCPQRRYGAVK